MQYDEEYFNSEDFQLMLSNYEESIASGNPLYLDADDFVDIADYYNMHGDNDLARDTVKRGLAIFPDDTLLNVFMSRQALASSNFKDARRYAARIADKDAPDYHYLKAEILIAQQRITDADRYLRELFRTIPPEEVQDYVKDVANLYVDYGISRKAYEWMMRSPGDNSDDFKELMARALFGLGKYKDSQRLFNELIDHNPYSKHYWTALATAQYMDEDYGAAVTSSEYAIAIDPDDPDSLIAKANSLLKLGNYEQAAEYYARYAKACPTDVLGFLHQAACLVNIGRHQEAVSLLQTALPLAEGNDPILAQIYQELAFAYSGCGQLAKAMKALDQTEDLPCDHSDMLVIRGHLLLSNQDIGGAEKAFRKAMRESEGDPDIILRIIVSVYDNHFLNACHQLFKHFFEGIAEPDYPHGHAYMALCCWELGYEEEFLKYLRIATFRDPHEARAVLAHLFPEGMDVKDYYKYMKEKVG